MSKFQEIIRGFANSHEAVSIVLPELGPTLAVIHKFTDDVAQVLPTDDNLPMITLHYSQVIIRQKRPS